MARANIEPESTRGRGLPPFRDLPLQLSDDECVRKLAKLVENRDDDTLSVVARLIGRLAVPVE